MTVTSDHSSSCSSSTSQAATAFELHPKAQDMPLLPVARFVRLPGDDRLFAFACGFPSKDTPACILVSSDQGQSWTPTGPFMETHGMQPTDSGAFLATSKGSLIAAFSDLAQKGNWYWDPALKDSPGATIPLYVTRSDDAGKTWSKPALLNAGWIGASRDIVETSSGRIVLATTQLRHQPGRHTVLTYQSDDDGLSWTPSNVLDFGGMGNHDGLSEATMVILNDGKILKYIRTPWGRFWRAISSDQGNHWHPLGPSELDASAAPGFLYRLNSGRIALAWNRKFPQGQTSWPLRGGDGMWSSTPASTFRSELSIAFSDDDCQTWSTPVVIASKARTEVAYPYIFEPTPGELWVTAYRYGLRIKLRELDVYQPVQSVDWAQS